MDFLAKNFLHNNLMKNVNNKKGKNVFVMKKPFLKLYIDYGCDIGTNKSNQTHPAEDQIDLNDID